MDTRQIISQARRDGRTLLTEIESKQVLHQAGIPVAEAVLAASEAEAVSAAADLGVPVALKIVSEDIPHKSDVGGVRLGLRSVAEVAQAYCDILASVGQARPDARVQGVAVQRMIGQGTEVVLGASRHPVFGPVLMFGLGGILVEVLQDVAFRRIPLDRRDAREMIQEIKGYKLLTGYRGRPAADLRVLEGLLMRLARLARQRPEIAEIDVNPLLIEGVRAIAVDARVVLRAAPAPSPQARPEPAERVPAVGEGWGEGPGADGALERVFNPKTIVAVGDRYGYGKVWPQRLRTLGTFKGKVYCVGTDPEDLPMVRQLGMEPRPSLLDVPGPVDHVMAGVAPEHGLRLVEECIQKDVGGLVYITPGFAETTLPDARRIQRQVAELAAAAGLLMIGPNCWGVYNPSIGLRQNGAQPHGHKGSVGYVTQSGEQCTRMSIEGFSQGIRISKAVTLGNAVLIGPADILNYLGQDEDTRIIGMVLEAVRDGERFAQTLQEVAARKPVIIWKAGQTPAGVRATATHTGSLMAIDRVWSSVLRQCGAIEVNSLPEMMDTLKAFLYLKPQTGNRVGIITPSGGDMVSDADIFARAGLELPRLSKASLPRAIAPVPVGGKAQPNPIDMSSSFVMGKDGAADVIEMLKILDQDRNIDWVVLHFDPAILRTLAVPEERIAATTIDFISTARTAATKPLVVILTGRSDDPPVVQARQKLAEMGIPNFSAEGAATAIKNLLQYGRFRGRAAGTALLS